MTECDSVSDADSLRHVIMNYSNDDDSQIAAWLAGPARYFFNIEWAKYNNSRPTNVKLDIFMMMEIWS